MILKLFILNCVFLLCLSCTPYIHTSEEKIVRVGSLIELPHEKLTVIKISSDSIFLKSKYRDLILRKNDDIGENMGESIRLKMLSSNQDSSVILISRSRGGYMFP
jgi:hypothetical protein